MLRDEATSYLKSVQWEQSQRAKNLDNKDKDESILLYLSRANNGSNVTVTSVSKTVLALKKRLLPESVAIPLYLNQTLFAVQEGLTMGIWIKDSYYDASGLSSLSENKSALDRAGKREYESKMHTATAFMGAEFLYQEYKDISIWYGITGYVVATGTGLFRMYNNRHWLTDVATGAGIGILSTKIAYWVHPWIKKIFYKDKEDISGTILPLCNGRNYGLGIIMTF